MTQPTGGARVGLGLTWRLSSQRCRLWKHCRGLAGASHTPRACQRQQPGLNFPLLTLRGYKDNSHFRPTACRVLWIRPSRPVVPLSKPRPLGRKEVGPPPSCTITPPPDTHWPLNTTTALSCLPRHLSAPLPPYGDRFYAALRPKPVLWVQLVLGCCTWAAGL